MSLKRVFLLSASALSLVVKLGFAADETVAQTSEPTPAEVKPEIIEPAPVENTPEIIDSPEVEMTPEAIEPPPPPPPVELTPAQKRAQEIEPGFLLKDERATQLFLLQQLAIDNDDALKKKLDQKALAREIYARKFRDDLSAFAHAQAGALGVKMDAAIDEAIVVHENALKHHKNNPVYAADAMYRLGLYYFEKDEKDYFEKLAKYNDAREQGREDVAYPDENFNRTIELYENLIDDYPEYRHSDGVYYLLALALWYEGAFYNSVARFQKLIAKYPQSRYVEEVWFRLGEYHYDMNEYDEAVAAYKPVYNNPKSPLYDKAIYKTAWSHYQKDRFMAAIDDFIKVVELTSAKGESASTGMRAEVTRFIVKSFNEHLLMQSGRKTSAPELKKVAKVKKPSQALAAKTLTKEEVAAEKAKPKLNKSEREYAEKLGLKLADRVIDFLDEKKNPPYARDILIEMASQLLDESKIEGAVRAFERTIALDPTHQDNPRLAAQIVDILQENDHESEARERNQKLISNYGNRSRWYRSKEGNYIAQSHAREAVRDAMLALAVYHHKTGKQLKDEKNTAGAEENFKRAASLYARYLREYPERDDTHKAIFYMAEAAFELERFRFALDAYQMLKDYPLPMPDNIRRDATFNIVFTFRHVLENEAKAGRFKEVDFDALTSKSRGAEPEEIPELGKKYLASIDEFLKIAPEDDQVPVLLFHAAAIYYVYGHADEAQTRFYYVIDNYPKATAASVAARLIIDDAVSKEEWSRVLELAKTFKEKNLGGKEGDFARIEGNAKFKIARGVYESANALQESNQLADAKAKFKESAELFTALLAEDPKNPHADIMLFNSARAIALSGTTSAALPLYRKLYKDYPNSEYAKSARFQEALALEKMLKFSEAATAYDGIIKEDPKSEAAGDAMLNKALLYEAAGDLTNASAAFVDFAKRYPDRVEAPDAYLSAAGIYKKMGKVNQQIAMLEQFIKQYRKDKSKLPAVIEAHVQVADTYGDLERNATTPAQKKNYEKLRRENYRSAVELYSADLNSAVAAFFAAKAQLALEKPEQDAFKTLTINARVGKAQGEQLTVMMKSLAELSKKNEDIIRIYAQPVWNAEALRRIGALYEHLAKSMVKAPCPRDVASVDEFACDEYMVLLEDKAAVLEKKALDAYLQAYEIAMTAYDSPPDLVTNILSGLNRLRPGEYQRVGNLIEQPKTGEIFGQGRMLSTGKMASSLHGKEIDPDRKPEPEAIPAPEPKVEESQPKDEAKPVEEQPAPSDDEGDDMLGEEF